MKACIKKQLEGSAKLDNRKRISSSSLSIKKNDKLDNRKGVEFY